LKNLENENEKSLQMGKEGALKTWNSIRKQKAERGRMRRRRRSSSDSRVASGAFEVGRSTNRTVSRTEKHPPKPAQQKCFSLSNSSFWIEIY